MNVKAAFVVLHWSFIYARRDLDAAKSLNYFFLRFRDTQMVLTGRVQNLCLGERAGTGGCFTGQRSV